MQIPFLLYISIAFIVVCVTGRKHTVGGWLLYFYYWIFAVLFISLWDIARHLNVYSPSFRSESVNHEALVLAVFPRLFVYLAVAAVAIVLLVKKEWVWVERLRVVLLAAVLIAGLSLWLDVRYFPGSTRSNVQRWIGLCLWLTYFLISKRVHHVFRTHDWDKFVGQMTTDS
jgi:hypothetical protein